MILIQILLFIVGCWLMTRQLIHISRAQIRSPYTIFAGIVLALQLPIAIGIGFAIGGAESIKAARQGVDGDVARSRFMKKYWWLDLVVPGTALVLAGGVLLAGSRIPVSVPPPPDDPVGITDLRNKLSELDLPWDGPEAIPRDPNDLMPSEMAIRESRRSSIRI